MLLSEISKLCARVLFEKNAIEEKDVNEARFGIEVFITHIITFGSIFIIGAMTNCLTKTVLFCIVFCHLRSFSNGFHAKSFFQCFTWSTRQ